MLPGNPVFVQPAESLKDSAIGVVIINSEGYIKEYNQIREYDHVQFVGKVLGKYHES